MTVPTLFIKLNPVHNVDVFFRIVGELMILIIWARAVLCYRLPVDISISKFDHTVKYRTIGCFGKVRTVTVFLENAHILYRHKPILKRQKGWHLVLFNRYFINKISIIEEEKEGFSKEQLDDIIAALSQNKGQNIGGKPENFVEDLAYFFM